MEKSTRKIKISGFFDSTPMEVTVRRPSILSLARAGKIPNPLMNAVMRLFEFHTTGPEPSLAEIADTMHLVAECCLVSPSYDSVCERLTDDQLVELYHFAKGGVEELEFFRRYRRIYADDSAEQTDGASSEQRSGD